MEAREGQEHRQNRPAMRLVEHVEPARRLDFLFRQRYASQIMMPDVLIYHLQKNQDAANRLGIHIEYKCAQCNNPLSIIGTTEEILFCDWCKKTWLRRKQN